MRMKLRGVDIRLRQKNGTEVMVSNVLIGEPASRENALLRERGTPLLTYTLGIPKGDPHDWVDAVAEFFGHRFRTVGLPMEGMEHLMPLAWGKNVRVQLLYTNGSCTLYEKDSFVRHYYPAVYLRDMRGTVVSKNGERSEGGLFVQIPGVENRDLSYIPGLGDILIPGDCPLRFDVMDEKTASESMHMLREQFPEFGAVRQREDVTCGVLPDYLLTVR